jgi:hypothetical protein
MQLHVFGASTPAGQAFRECVASAEPIWALHAYSRPKAAMIPGSSATNCFDFTNPKEFMPAGDIDAPAIWISFGPIWLLAPFLDQLASEFPERLAGLRGLIACSSSSTITKRFAFNLFDRQLVDRLNIAEQQLLATCSRHDLACRILQPTLIYGKAGTFRDHNLSRLLEMLSHLPVLPFPAQTGLRQPLHATQLAAVALNLAQRLAGPGLDESLPMRIALGGDTTLTYTEMIEVLQQSQPSGYPAHRCRLFPIPNRLFYFLTAPLLLRSPRAFESVLRISVNLSGFTPAHMLLGCEPQSFPVLPLA